MRKIYSLIALMLTCFVGTANAQKWSIEDGSNVAEIKEGVTYAIQQGDNTNDKGAAGPHSQSKFLGINQYFAAETDENLGVEVLKPECGFQFEKTGELVEDCPVYVLKNVSNGMYLTSAEGHFTNSKTKAFQFTARQGVLTPEPDAGEGATWDVYSQAVSDTRSVNAEGNWVFCHKSEKTFLCFYGAPAFAGYIDTNNWLVVKVNAVEMSAHDQFREVYEKYFGTGVDADKEVNEVNFPVGTNPGCVSQEFFDRLLMVFEDATAAYEDESTPAEECKRLSDAIVQIFEELKTAVLPVTPGFYVVKNAEFSDIRGFMTVTADGNNGRSSTEGMTSGKEAYAAWTPADVTAWTLDNAKYIWKLEPGEKEGQFLFKNFGTGKYLTKDNNYAVTEKAEDATSFNSPNFKGIDFNITYEGGMIHAGNWGYDYKLINAGPTSATGSRFQYYAIDKAVIDSLSTSVNQNKINSELSELVKTAESTFLGLQYKNGYLKGARYNAPADSGLTRTFKGNAVSEKWSGIKGNPDKSAGAFDGDINTCFHTAGDSAEVAGVAKGGNFWIQLDLGRKVKSVALKLSKRESTYNGHIGHYQLLAPVDGTADAADWKVVAESDGDSLKEFYTKPCGSIEGLEMDSAKKVVAAFYKQPGTHEATYTFADSVQYLRFNVTKSWGRNVTMVDGKGPQWHVAEFRIYDAEETVANPNFELVPEATRNALEAAIKVAQDQLAKDAGTQEAYDALDAALDAFNEAYPDATELKEALKANRVMANYAVEGETLGFFAAGAKATLLEAVDKIEAEIKKIEDGGASLTLAQINDFEKQLDEAVANFNAKLVVPESGAIYRVICTSGYDAENNEYKTNSGCMASVDADFYNGTPSWRYKIEEGVDNRFNTLWLVEGDVKKGFSFKNLANGLYINNVFEGLTEKEIEKLELTSNTLGYSKTPKFLTLQSFVKAEPAEGDVSDGSFVIKLAKNKFSNFQGDGSMVHYYDPSDKNAPFTFEKAEEVKGTYNLDVAADKFSIVTVPFDLAGAYSTDATGYYTVLGAKDGKLWLSAADAAIPAGTPFIVKTEAEQTTVDLVLPELSMDEYKNMKYNYETVVVNGLVSAPFSFKMEKGSGLGYLYDNAVVVAEGNEKIAAGTGFFNNTIPTITEEGDLSIAMEGDITGEGTAVEEVVVVKNVPMDVYTISGVKVRSNVKAANATQGLPKGLYIVGGQKVIVK